VRLRLLNQGIGEHLGEARRSTARWLLRSGDDVEAIDAMELVGGGLGGLVALALSCDDVDQDRSALGVAHVAQHRQEMIEIMPVDWGDVGGTEILETRAGRPKARGR